MKSIVTKLAMCVVTLIIAISLILTVSFAWMTLSKSPEAGGIQISIGGGQTILVAPNKTETVDGVKYNYPGAFSQKVNFNNHIEYQYLNEAGGLTPVSTADGLHWFLPSYYTDKDEAVINGEAYVGQIKPVSNFFLDRKLEYSNTPKESNGGYIYLDFWMVSPDRDYDLRLSKGDGETGTFLVELTSPEKSDGGYALKMSSGSVAASARVGFLVENALITDNTMLYYQRSSGYSEAYRSLKGSYGEPGEDIKYSNYDFTIYEPNANLHPNGEDGSYLITKPVGWNGGDYKETDISDRVSVQLASGWTQNGERNYIEEAFEVASAGKNFKSAEEAEEHFYKDFLKGQMSPYVEQGNFAANTSELYGMSENGAVSAEDMQLLEKAGATEDICVAHLERNIPQRIRMFVWIEGQDADCGGIVKDASFALSIELAGSNGINNEGRNGKEGQ